MKGLMFFSGSLLRWSVAKPKDFLFFHGYILFVYALNFLAHMVSFDASGLILTLGALGPLCLAISRGLPLDCLDYKAAIIRELTSD